MKPILRSCVAGLAFGLLASALASDPPSDPPSFALEVRKLQDGAKKGDLRAMGIIASLSRGGVVTMTKEERFSAAQTSAGQHQPMGLFALAQLYARGEGVEKNEVKSKELAREAVSGLIPLAEGGDAWAQFELGFAYAAGFGADQKPEEGVKWFRKAAEQGLAAGQAGLGRSYLAGIGIAKDPDEGVAWCRKAAGQGFGEADYLLAKCHLAGLGVPKSAQDAVEWLRKAADLGLAEAQNELATSFALGRGVEKNPAEAVKWYAKAAAQGNLQAQCHLGFCYKQGIGTVKNTREGLGLLRQAALRGSVVAQMILATTYLRGEGVPRDADEAKRWLFMASNSTNSSNRDLVATATKMLGRLTKSGTSSVPSGAPFPLASGTNVFPKPEAKLQLEPAKPAAPAQSGSSADNVMSGSLLFLPGKTESE